MRCLLRSPRTVMPLMAMSLLLFAPNKNNFVALADDFTFYEDFVTEVVTTNPGMSGVFAPNPRRAGNPPMLIQTSKDGKIVILEDFDNDSSSSGSTILSLDLGNEICTDEGRGYTEQGLYTVLASPNFLQDNHIFVFYTQLNQDCRDGPPNVAERLTMDPETLLISTDSSDRKIIFKTSGMYNINHVGGAMVFGNDGKLYITTGDSGDRRLSQPRNTLHGKVSRLNPDGSIPDDNPYTQASGYSNSFKCTDRGGVAPNGSYCSEIWAYGLRNPFRIDMITDNDDGKTIFSIGDAGERDIESIYYGGTDYKGANYGWPRYEGVCAVGDMDDCTVNPPARFTMPIHWYEHRNPDRAECVVGQAHVPKDARWPSQFKFLYQDYLSYRIYWLEENRPDLACDDCSPPLPPTNTEPFFESDDFRLVDMWFGPYQNGHALYVQKLNGPMVRIRYTGNSPSEAPTDAPVAPDDVSDAPTDAPVDRNDASDAPTDAPVDRIDASDAPTNAPVAPNTSDAPTSAPNDTPVTEAPTAVDVCEDAPATTKFDFVNNGREVEQRSCRFIRNTLRDADKPKRRRSVLCEEEATLQDQTKQKISSLCPRACQICPDQCKDKRARFTIDGNPKIRNCGYLEKRRKGLRQQLCDSRVRYVKSKRRAPLSNICEESCGEVGIGRCSPFLEEDSIAA